MPALSRRDWVPGACEDRVQSIAAFTAGAGVDALDAELARALPRKRVAG